MSEDAWDQAMRRGDFAGAWRINDDVLASRDPGRRDDPALPYHLRWVWDGTPLANRHCLVRCYHGLGDVLQFARFLPIAARMAASVTVEAPAPLCETLSVFAGICHIVAFDEARPLPPGECDIEIMELAHALRVTEVGMHAHYLQPPPASAMRGGAPAIGICWQSGDWDRDRALPLTLLLDALDKVAVLPVSLQRGTPMPPGMRHRLANPDDASMRVAETAALIAGLDVVVTVDGFVAHLAGAMGKPVHLLLKKNADWRWMTGGTTAWYPRATLFRQDDAGDWNGPLSKLAGAIALFRRE